MSLFDIDDLNLRSESTLCYIRQDSETLLYNVYSKE